MTDATKPHPDLPECPGCGATRWRADLVSFGRPGRWYSCTSNDCDARAVVVFYGIAFLIIWPCEHGEYRLHAVAAEWLAAVLAMISGADILACVGGQEPPTSIPLPVRPDGWPCYYGWREWHRIEMGQTVDVAPLFAERVAKLRAAEEARAS